MADVNSSDGEPDRSMLDLHRDIEDLSQRIARLEQSTGEPLRPAGSSESSSSNAAAPPATRPGEVDAMLRVTSPTYCAMALTQAHETFIRRDIARQSGDESLAAELDEFIAGLICVTMNRVVDEFSLPTDVQLEDAKSNDLS